MQKNIHIFILGNNQAGGAQHSFLREAKIIQNKTNSIIYFITAGKSNFSVCSDIKTNSINQIGFNSLLTMNPLTIISYAKFLYFTLKKIINLNNNSKIICSHTTPLASLITTTICMFLGIKETRYRIGGLINSIYLPYYFRIFGYFIDLYNLRFNKYISFVCFENKNQYIKSYPFLLGKLDKIDVFYSICTEISKSKKSSLEDKYIVIKNLKFPKKSNAFKTLTELIKEKNLIITITNDKSKKGAKLFYQIAHKSVNYNSLLFVHVGTRKFREIKLISENLLIVPHTSNDEVIQWIKLAQMTVLLSKYPEGLAQVIPQSLFCGKPVFCIENAGVHECITNHFNGLIVPNNYKENQIFSSLINFIFSDNFRNISINTKKLKDFYKKRHSDKYFEKVYFNSNFNKSI